MYVGIRHYFFIGLFLLLFYSSISFANTPIAIEIIGVNEALKKNILSTLDVQTIAQSTPAEIHAYFSASPAAIQKALEPFGYFKAVVSYTLREEKGKWLAQFYITPGPALHLRKVDIAVTGSGRKKDIFQNILRKAGLRAGDIFSVPKYLALKKALFNTALAQGYFDAKYTDADILIDLVQYTGEIRLHLDTGMRYRFGPFSFNKNPYDATFLSRFADFSPHAEYAADKVQTFQEALSSSGYFKEVFVEPQVADKKNNEIPLHIQVKPLPAKQYHLGLGYGTDTGVRGSAAFEHRRVTASGQRIKTEIQASETEHILQTSYIIPGKKPATDQYILSASIQRENQILGESDTQKLALSYVKEIAEWQQTLALTAQRERFFIEDVPGQTQFLVVPSIGWMKSTQDDPLHPARGSKINIAFLYAPSLFKKSSFFQSRLGLKEIYPVLKKDRVILRGNFSHTQIQQIEDLPLSFQFFAGGAQSIRGYAYNSIGPGSIAWVGSLEYQRHIKGNWYLSAFYDIGHVGNRIAQDIKRGIGLGIVWQSPVGALQLTAAQAQDLPGKPIAIQFSMGPLL